ncbi:hypothetical protein R1flu_002762 [Riccia fluitans]|uniref:Uncharacterized protein n=1 Tax=Riccia fluitans TaxID=41844 RepID=A0ABD1Y720_9MARC
MARIFNGVREALQERQARLQALRLEEDLSEAPDAGDDADVLRKMRRRRALTRLSRTKNREFLLLFSLPFS